jgi:hypothetical protein
VKCWCEVSQETSVHGNGGVERSAFDARPHSLLEKKASCFRSDCADLYHQIGYKFVRILRRLLHTVVEYLWRNKNVCNSSHPQTMPAVLTAVQTEVHFSYFCLNRWNLVVSQILHLAEKRKGLPPRWQASPQRWRNGDAISASAFSMQVRLH